MNLLTRAGICALIMVAGLVSAARAQLILNRQVTATAGGSGTTGNVRIQYTIGEPVISMITDGKVLLTEGFQQPEELPPNDPLKPVVKSYMIFPNPASTVLRVQMELLATKDVQLALLNTAGQVLYITQQTLGSGTNTLTISVDKFAAGIYTVRLKVGLELFFEKIIIQ